MSDEEEVVSQEQLTTDLSDDLTFAMRELQKWYISHELMEEDG